MHKYAQLSVALISGVLFTLSFAPWDFTFLLFFALVPWLWFLFKSTDTIKKAIKHGLLLSFFMSIFAFYWVATVLINYSGLHWIWGIIGLFLYAWVGQPQMPIFALCIVLWKRKRPLPSPARLALLYTAIDFTLPKLFVDSLGHATYHWQHIRQSADLLGVPLLTFLFAWSNLSLVQIIQDLRARGVKRAKLLGAVRKLGPVMILTSALWTYGVFRIEDIRTKTSPQTAGARTLRAALIQANVGDFDKIAAERGVRGAADQVVTHFLQLSEQALQTPQKPDLVIWPETAFPSTFRSPLTPDELRRDQMLERFSQQNKTVLAFGGYDHAAGRDFNTLYFLNPSGDSVAYHKNILLLFGETIPGAEFFPWIRQTFPQVGQFGRGPGPMSVEQKTPRLGSVFFAPIICYEALFPWYLVDAVNQGAQVILNVTNDSWFGAYGEPELHLALSSFRSIETRTPQLRSTNTGISALIDATGEILAPTSKFTTQILPLEVTLPTAAPRTLYRVLEPVIRWGLRVILGGELLGILLLGHSPRRPRKPS